MIQPREIRVGNAFYIMSRTHEVHMPIEVPFQVATIGTFEVQLYRPYEYLKAPLRSIDCRDLSPIPLTSKIFQSCSAKQGKGGGGILDKYLYGIDFPNNSAVLGVVQDARGNILINGKDHTYTEPCIKYLHQLQNFYFANSGEELIIYF